MRPRTKNKDLPPYLQFKHGAYYYTKGKWQHLGRDRNKALGQYALLIRTPENSVTGLLTRFLTDAEKRVAANTYAQYKIAADRITATFVEFSVDQVRPTHIAQFMDHHRHTPNMANRMLSVIKMSFDHAVLMGYCQSNPCISVPRHKEAKRERYLTDEEYAAIRSSGNPALIHIMDLAYLTGQRIGDVLKIKLGDISAEGIKFKQQKTEKRLLISMTPDLDHAIILAKKQHRHISIYLLGQRNGKIRSYRGVRDLFARAAKKAGIDDAHLHDIRAKSLTDAKQQGLNPQILGGHSTEAMTNRYLRGKETVIAIGPSFKTAGVKDN